MNRKFILAIAFIGSAFGAGAQAPNAYKPAMHVMVEKGAKTLSAPFCGGFNIPQFAMADLNNDGKQDLVSFEGYGKMGVRTFINYGAPGAPEYRYEPRYERSFPEIVNYLILKDYNGDGIADLFHNGLGGYNVSKGYYANGALHFQFMKELSYIAFGQQINAYVNNADIPAIVDVDDDGDLDFFSFSINGSRILFYKNLQAEYGLHRDSIRLMIASGCWGGTFQHTVRTHQLGIPRDQCDTNYFLPPPSNPSGGTGLPPALAKTTMHGSNSLCVLDIDGDGDYDYLNGNGAFNDLQLLLNGRKEHFWKRDSMVAQDTLWQRNGIRYVQSNYPAAFNLDFNGDGLKDIMIAPHGPGSKNRGQVWYYQNNGTTSTPSYNFVTDSLFANDIIDVGKNSRPLFYDFNRDGKPDLLIGGIERLGNGRDVSRLFYYENITATEAVKRPSGTPQSYTGSSSAPRFRFITNDLVGVSGLNVFATDPAVGDVDGDGKDDLVIGRVDGKLVYFRNTAVSDSLPPVWTLKEMAMTRDGATRMEVWSEASPVFYDINKDGKPDLLVGQDDGTLTAFLNTNTTSGQVSYGPAIDSFGGVRIPDWGASPQPFRKSKPFIGKLQVGSNKDYLLMGGIYGRLYVWDEISTGNVNHVLPLVADTFSNLKLQSNTAPAVADVDGDGMLEMVVGTELGGLMLYWTGKDMGVQTPERTPVAQSFQVFPNPAAGSFTVDISTLNNRSGTVLTVLDLTGRMVFREQWPAGKEIGQIATQGWLSGTYLISVAGEQGVETQKLQILH